MLRWFHCSAANVLATKIGNIFTTYRSIESPLLSALRSFFIHSLFPHTCVCVFVCVWLCLVFVHMLRFYCIRCVETAGGFSAERCRASGSIDMSAPNAPDYSHYFSRFIGKSLCRVIIITIVSPWKRFYIQRAFYLSGCAEREREPHICHWYSIEPERLHNDWNGFGWSSVCLICTAMSGIQHTKKYTRKLASIIYKIDNPSDVI